MWDKTTIIAALRVWNVEHGRPPSVRQCARHVDRLPPESAMRRHFGGFNNAIEAAGLPANRPLTPKTNAQLLDDVRAWAARRGRAPTSRECDDEDTLPSATLLARRFGGTNAALVSAGLKPVRGTPKLRRARRRPAPRPQVPRARGLVQAGGFKFAPAANRSTVPAGCPLSDREFEMMRLLARGATYKEMGLKMGISTSGVRSLAHTAFDRLGVGGGRGAAAAVVMMKDSGWIGASPRTPQLPDDSRIVTPVQLAYCSCFVALCQQRTPRAAAIVTVAFGLLSAVHGVQATAPRRVPDIDELLLRLARGLARPIYDGLEDGLATAA